MHGHTEPTTQSSSSPRAKPATTPPPWPEARDDATTLTGHCPRHARPHGFPDDLQTRGRPPAQRKRPRGKCEGKVAMDSVPGLRTRRRRQGIAALRSYHHRMAVVGSRHRGKRAKGWGELATTA